MIEQKSQVLFEENFPIKGTEPFSRFGFCGIVLSLHAGLYGTHTLIEKFGPHVPICNLGKGDTLRVQLVRVHSGKVVWKQKIKQVWSWLKGLKK